ncbi:DUF3761 domain-containing protein [Actinacidiphila acidipaludis]|nr:DUF3761 domain-containing protein [Streptomyces acidipaludis]
MHARKAVAIIALLTATCAGVAACNPDATTDSSRTAAPTATAATADTAKAVPNFVGMGLQDAQDAAQAKGFHDLTSHDATGQGRHQILDRNWTVCDQTPAAGSPAAGSVTIDMGAVKTDETCPSASPSASPTASPSPTPSPTPAPTSPHPKPSPRPTHHASTSSGGSGGTSSSSGGSGGGSTHTDPPVDDHGGATALCNDGTLSFSAHHRGTCSHHGGVAVFYH